MSPTALAAAIAAETQSGSTTPKYVTSDHTFAAATLLADELAYGRIIDARALRGAMERAFGASDAAGAWDWKTAYDACEAAQVLFLRKFAAAMRDRAGSPHAFLDMLGKLAALLPSHTRRSEESQALQQFSTPIAIGFAAAQAAAATAADVLLEPSAGTGLLAVFAELAGANLHLNEISERRAGLLGRLFPRVSITSYDAAHIDDHLDAALRPSLILMNPPFSRDVHVEARMNDTALRHINSGLARLADGGRLVAITGAYFSPENPDWRARFVELQQRAQVVFTVAIHGSLYSRHGTTTDVRLTVIDRVSAPDPTKFPDSPGMATDAATLLDCVLNLVPPRHAAKAASPAAPVTAPTAAKLLPIVPKTSRATTQSAPLPFVELAYEAQEPAHDQGARMTDALYEPYRLQSIRIPGAAPHPTALVQSAAIASVAPPKASYRPRVTPDLVAEGLLSEPQLESVIYAGEAHSAFLAGSWTVDQSYDCITPAADDAEWAVRYRRGWMLGDGTGAGKGRQVAGIILDNWLQGRQRAVWISKSDKLIEDAQRDWSALDQERLQIVAQARFRQGTAIRLNQGILFSTYATLRSEARGDRVSRVQQIVDWLGRDFDGVIVFDECHAMGNAGGGKTSRGEQAGSLQGRAGLRLQHALPSARIVYVSATGATTVQNLAYAQRLGLWGGEDFPFAKRTEFVTAIEAGGVAAMEVLARDLRALGLYSARSLSYEGVEYQPLEHQLTPEQIRIYDAYAHAFQIIHNNLDVALDVANASVNRQAKSAARSTFESTKQRFFSHLITSMQTPSVIASIERDVASGRAAVVQIVSTGEALIERRLADIPTNEWNDLQVDATPREYVLGYLARGFPTQLYEPFSDEEGNLTSRPVSRDGQSVQCREAVARRDHLIERLAALPSVPAALDQVIHHFGTDRVAEVTGRSRRVVSKQGRLCVETRPASANLGEAHAFMDDDKQILVFSDAGGTGRSYHADLAARNQRPRVHYLLEPGWKADTAIQGLGRTNRTNQAQPPLFRPCASNVKAQKRFLSTIARRLDSLGAITRGQRQTGGQGLFRPEDNLESFYATDALRQFYYLVYAGKVPSCPLETFEATTGLRLGKKEGGLRDDLPPITTFLNRLAALTISMQDALFAVFEGLLTQRIEGAIEAGVYDPGVETFTAESLVVTERHPIHVHPTSGAETQIFTIIAKERNRPLSLEAALATISDDDATAIINTSSGRAALQLPPQSCFLDDGATEDRVTLIHPLKRERMAADRFARTNWRPASKDRFAKAWEQELATIPEFRERQLHIVTGLLLPIWRRLPKEDCRVYRLQTDAGERIIGRLVPADWVSTAVPARVPTLSTPEAWTNLLEGKTHLELQDGLRLRRSTVMYEHRVELLGFTDGEVDRLKAMGLVSEIISWKLRLFIPTSDAGPSILASVLARYPLQRLTTAGGTT